MSRSADGSAGAGDGGCRTVHTADLGAGERAAVRALLDDAFAGDLDDDDWEHALGGLHVLRHDDGGLVGHAAVVQRRLVHAGTALRCGYVEAVAVRPDRRGRGHGAALLGEVGRVLRGAYDLGALGATEAGAALYARAGWQRWRGSTWALTPEGRRRTPDDDGAVMVLPVAVVLDLDGELTCDWRDGDVW